MATKRRPPLDDPPSASSDEDDETEDEQEQEAEPITQKTPQQESQSEESEEEEEDDESESEEQMKKPQIPNPNSKSESESEEDEESDSEEEQETQTPKSSSVFEFESDIQSPSVSNFAIKPAKKIANLSTPERKVAIKRPSVNSDLKNKKKVKVSNADENKSSVIKRVWSEEDELTLLQGFIDYQAKNGCSPLSDMDSFYQFSMDSLPGNASKSQLYEKVRRLKKKFRVNEAKVTATGEDPVFVKPHERTLFEVSKKIWGVNGCETVGNVNGSSVKPKARSVKPKQKAKAEVKEEVVDDEMMVEEKAFETLYPYWNAGLNLGDALSLNFPTGIVGWFREDLNLIEEAKATEMNEKWKALFENEAVLQKRKKALLRKVST